MKTMKDCIESGDMAEAFSRYKKANARWLDQWFATCLLILKEHPEFADKFNINETERLITRIKERIDYSEKIFFEIENDELLTAPGEKCYLFEFYDDDNNLICSKVGTTKRTINQRIKEELRSKTYVEMGATKCYVKRVYDCRNYPAEGLESFLRAINIKHFPDNFQKNDRFMNIKFDFNATDLLYKEFFEEN